VSLNFNRANLSERPISQTINELIERPEPPRENYRQYLSASSIGAECLRKTQFDWMCNPVFPARIKDIFGRGHYFEGVTRAHLIAAGFQFAPENELEFKAADGLFRGHADGIITAGPELPALIYPCVWEHKALGAKGWRAVERDGLVGLYEVYAAQIAIYQAYLDCANPALFSCVNADTCERLHFAVPFNAQLAQATSDRAVAVIEATRAGELLPRVTEDPTDWRCKTCSHKDRCWRQSRENPPAPPEPHNPADLSIPSDLSIPKFLRRTADGGAP
jgi:hypothetical protein